MSGIEFILTSVVIAVIAVVFSAVLTQEGMLLNFLWKFLNKHIGNKPFLFNPLIDCPKCVSGQIALWYYLIAYWHEYSFIIHVSLISVTIFISLIIYKIYLWASS